MENQRRVMVWQSQRYLNGHGAKGEARSEKSKDKRDAGNRLREVEDEGEDATSLGLLFAQSTALCSWREP